MTMIRVWKFFLFHYKISLSFFLIFLFCIVGSIFTVFSYRTKQAQSILLPKKNLNISLEKQEWRKYIQQIGTQKAYTDIKYQYRDSPLNVQHLMMHMMGELFYEEKGIEGITFCDSSFSYGCYHGFFSNAIQDTGLTKISEMDLACVKRFGYAGTGCQHGIGHGILIYLGKEKLLEALHICDTLTWKGKIGGCRNGVFMEYNLSTSDHSGFAIVRPLNASPYSPCSSLPEKYRYACYFGQPGWWDKVYNHNYKKIGELCGHIEEESHDICFLGTGRSAVESSAFNVEDTIMKCNQITSAYDSMLCKAGALWTFNTSFPDNGNGEKLCESVPASLQKVCVTRSHVI
jgi:hypothetical protein